MAELIYQAHPTVIFATNHFIGVPIILQYDETPMLSIVKAAQAGFTTEIPIYHNDGTYLAKVVGSQIYATPAGKKAGIITRNPPNMTVCEMGGKTVFELRRDEAAALHTSAELYAPDGIFLKAANSNIRATAIGGEPLQIGGLYMEGNVITGFKIGVLIKRGANGLFGAMGAGGPAPEIISGPA